MRKCSICGNVISDFASECPHCGKDLKSMSKIEDEAVRVEYNLRNTQKNILLNFIASIVVVFFFDFALNIPGFIPFFLIELALKLVCVFWGVSKTF